MRTLGPSVRRALLAAVVLTACSDGQAPTSPTAPPPDTTSLVPLPAYRLGIVPDTLRLRVGDSAEVRVHLIRETPGGTRDTVPWDEYPSHVEPDHPPAYALDIVECLSWIYGPIGCTTPFALFRVYPKQAGLHVIRLRVGDYKPSYPCSSWWGCYRWQTDRQVKSGRIVVRIDID